MSDQIILSLLTLHYSPPPLQRWPVPKLTSAKWLEKHNVHLNKKKQKILIQSWRTCVTFWSLPSKKEKLQSTESTLRCVLSECVLVSDVLSYISLVKHHDGHGIHFTAFLSGFRCNSKTLWSNTTFSTHIQLRGKCLSYKNSAHKYTYTSTEYTKCW